MSESTHLCTSAISQQRQEAAIHQHLDIILQLVPLSPRQVMQLLAQLSPNRKSRATTSPKSPSNQMTNTGEIPILRLSSTTICILADGKDLIRVTVTAQASMSQLQAQYSI